MADEPNNDAPAGDEAEDEKSEPAEQPKAPDTPAEPEIPAALQAVINKERRAARDAEKRAKAAESELGKIKETTMTEHERAVKAARDAGLSEGVKQGNARLLRAEVISAAAGKFVDPDEAFVLLRAGGSLDGIEVSETGEVDNGAIKGALDDLIKAKPHLGVRRGPTPGQRSPANFEADNSSAAFDKWIRQEARK